MANTRITKAQYFTDICNMLSGRPVVNEITPDMAIAFCEREMEMLAKKNSSTSRKPTAAQEANENYKTLILDFLAGCENPMTCTEIQRGIPEFADFNNQKIASLMSALNKAGKVVKETVKNKSVFTLA